MRKACFCSIIKTTSELQAGLVEQWHVQDSGICRKCISYR